MEGKESDLYAPVRDYLTQLGYDVQGEVKDCDLTAVRGDELIVGELKRGFTIELLYQAIDGILTLLFDKEEPETEVKEAEQA